MPERVVKMMKTQKKLKESLCSKEKEIENYIYRYSYWDVVVTNEFHRF